MEQAFFDASKYYIFSGQRNSLITTSRLIFKKQSKGTKIGILIVVYNQAVHVQEKDLTTYGTDQLSIYSLLTPWSPSNKNTISVILTTNYVFLNRRISPGTFTLRGNWEILFVVWINFLSIRYKRSNSCLQCNTCTPKMAFPDLAIITKIKTTR